ncbi:MAG: ATP-binding cassette domain-containing protein [Acidimicrobiia bacterium]
MPAEPMIDLADLTKVFRGSDAPAVDGLSLAVEEAETVVLVGPSGCGKTTTLKMINRLIEPTSGSITVAGRDVTLMESHELRRGIGYVIQQIGLFPHRTIRDNIATVPSLLGWGKSTISDRVDELADMVDIDPAMLDRYPAELSGGQRQRVGVARALAADPPVLLMDEPFGAVDPIVRARLQHELKELQARLHKTIVLVTHDIDEAILLGDRIAILNVGGILEQYQTPAETLRDPANPFVAGFLGSDRGIKRLSLIPISTIDLVAGPVVAPDASIQEVRTVALGYGVDWVAVLDGESLLGWKAVADVTTDGDAMPGHDPRPFASTLSPADSLKEALDAVVTSHTSVAAVIDDGRYLGMLTMDEISKEIIQ